MFSAQGRAVMRAVFVILCLVQSAKRFWRSVLMSMVLGVFSTQLIRMDRVLDRPDFIEIKGVFTDLQKREKLDIKEKEKRFFYLRPFLRVFLLFLLFLLLLAGAGL
jgi:hypothetical protein